MGVVARRGLALSIVPWNYSGLATLKRWDNPQPARGYTQVI